VKINTYISAITFVENEKQILNAR